jgi:hypothetical protein
VLPVVPDFTGPFEIGTSVVTWLATDNAGNDGIAEQLVIVQDSTAPVVTAPAAITEISAVPVELNIG